MERWAPKKYPGPQQFRSKNLSQLLKWHGPEVYPPIIHSFIPQTYLGMRLGPEPLGAQASLVKAFLCLFIMHKKRLVFPTLQMGKLSLGKIKSLTLGCTVNK